jgi:hypothetical protein
MVSDQLSVTKAPDAGGFGGHPGSGEAEAGSSIMGGHRNVRELRFFERDCPRNAATCAARRRGSHCMRVES